MMAKRIICLECDREADWKRCRQFSGTQYFCTPCAQKQPDYSKRNDPLSDSRWIKLYDNQKTIVHPIKIVNYDGSLEDLANEICRMRYDRTAEFFKACSIELQRQAVADSRRNRPQLAKKLLQASNHCAKLTLQISKIFELCKPHMVDEL